MKLIVTLALGLVFTGCAAKKPAMSKVVWHCDPVTVDERGRTIEYLCHSNTGETWRMVR